MAEIETDKAFLEGMKRECWPHDDAVLLLRSGDLRRCVSLACRVNRSAVLEEAATVVDAKAEEWRRQRDPGPVYHAQRYAAAIRALK